MGKYLISFFVFLAMAWMGNNVLQAQQEISHLALYKDSFYSTLYHADLKTALSADTALQWEIRGGRYHIYEEELPFFKKLRPFQRTILFLEKTKYDVFVTFTREGYPQETNHVELDFSGLSSSSSSSSGKTELELDKLSPLPGEAIQLKASGSSLEELHRERWEVKRLQKVTCPSLEDVLAEVIQSELSTISEICDRSYEEPMEEGKDYLLEKDQASNKVYIIFKMFGHYAIYFWGYDAQGQLLSKSSRKIVLEEVKVSHR